VLLRRGGGTAIPHHHALIILVAGVPPRPFDDTGGRIAREDEGRHPEPPEVDTAIGGVEGAGGVLGDHDVLGRGASSATIAAI
jgi:hypothetical protein